MKHASLSAAALVALTLPLTTPLFAQEQAEAAPSPNAIVDGAPDEAWVAIASEDLVVMTLAPDRDGKPRQVVIQLMPAPFSQGWVENIRKLARAKWYDGISVNRVQDNYVVQWGDPGHDNPEGEGIETKPLPDGLRVMGEEAYTSKLPTANPGAPGLPFYPLTSIQRSSFIYDLVEQFGEVPQEAIEKAMATQKGDIYAVETLMMQGWPFGAGPDEIEGEVIWPVHCYGMVGVGRNYSPDTGSGAELYTVIGHAPRHLDRNIALAGRVISGMEHLSSMTRGTGALGFYTEDEAHLRTPILSIRVASDLPETERPAFEYLNTEGETFAAYAEARANRRDPFFIVPAGGADICNIPVPIRAQSNSAASE